MKKSKQIHQTYLYLGRRDERGAKLVARFKSEVELITRVTNVKSLNLPANLEKQIEQIAYENRKDWELWIETVDTYEDLKKKLYKRGYSKVSMNPVPMVHEFSVMKTVNDKNLRKPPKTMLPRGRR